MGRRELLDLPDGHVGPGDPEELGDPDLQVEEGEAELDFCPGGAGTLVATQYVVVLRPISSK